VYGNVKDPLKDRGQPTTGLSSTVDDLGSGGRAARTEAKAIGQAEKAVANELKAVREVEQAALKRADNVLGEHLARQASAAETRQVASGHISDLFAEMEAKGWVGSAKSQEFAALRKSDPAAWSSRMELEFDGASIIGNPVGQSKTLLDKVVSETKKFIKNTLGGVSAASETERRVIEKYARQGYDLEIRNVDRLTAFNSRVGASLGLEAKPEMLKAKSFFGLSWKPEAVGGDANKFTSLLAAMRNDGLSGAKTWAQKNLYRGDLDLAKASFNGQFMNNEAVLALAGKMNADLVSLGHTPSFLHGSHFTMDPGRGGYLSFVKIKSINGPGDVTSFKLGLNGGLAEVQIREAELYQRALFGSGGETWYKSWDRPTNYWTGSVVDAGSEASYKSWNPSQNTWYGSAWDATKSAFSGLSLPSIPEKIQTDAITSALSPSDGAFIVRDSASGAKLLAGQPSGGAAGEAVALADTRALLALEQDALKLWQLSVGFVPMHVRLAIADLPDGELGEAYITRLDANGLPSEGKIVIDFNGDGQGWFVDSTPFDASEFAQADSAAQGRYDLLSVLLHETAHILGFTVGYDGYDQRLAVQADGSLLFVGDTFSAAIAADGSHLVGVLGDLMGADLPLSVRMLPSGIDAQIIAAARTVTVTADNTPAPATAASAVNTPQTPAAPADAVNTVVLDAPGVLVQALTAPVHDGAGGSAFINGSFDVADAASVSYGWLVTGNAGVQNGEGVLGENARLASRLQQSFTLPAGAQQLQFTVTGGALAGLSGMPPDAFEAALLDASTLTSLVGTAALSGSDAFLNVQAGGAIHHSGLVSVTDLQGNALSVIDFTQPVRISVDLSAVAAGTQVALFFDLLGFGSLDSSVRIDDVRFIVPGANQAPVAGADSVTLAEDSSVLIDVLANDSDADGNTLTITAVGDATHGTVAIENGQVRYTPAANWNGADSFDYTVGDGAGGTSSGTVSITVTSVNDAPVLPDVLPIQVAEGTALELQAVATDLDGDALVFSLDAAPVGASIDAATGLISWTASDGNAAYGFTLRVSDGQASATRDFTVNVTNVAPELTVGGLEHAYAWEEYALLLSSQDVGQDTITQWVIDWGDGNTETFDGNPSLVTHVYTGVGGQQV
ncbi:MAG: cadherin-like domain-containing protein, partial [Sideroxydans sp.]|nr:cadherin-like domain-containing protein [Sideroxydans sp.]